MPLISFSEETSIGPFHCLIRKGIKRSTMREPRKVPVKEGDRLYLYWKVRVPVDKKEVHKIADAICISTRRVKYKDFASNEEVSKIEGFGSVEEMQAWFGTLSENGETEYDEIVFELWPFCPDCDKALLLHKHGSWVCRSDSCWDYEKRSDKVIGSIPDWYEIAITAAMFPDQDIEEQQQDCSEFIEGERS